MKIIKKILLNYIFQFIYYINIKYKFVYNKCKTNTIKDYENKTCFFKDHLKYLNSYFNILYSLIQNLLSCTCIGYVIY